MVTFLLMILSNLVEVIPIKQAGYLKSFTPKTI